MAGPFTGMDIEAVKALATQLNTRADDIRHLMTQLTTQLNNTQWVGADASRFQEEWQSQHCVALNSVITGLTDAASRANNNAIEQANASM